MTIKKRLICFLALIILLFIELQVNAQENFDKVDNSYYRAAQPNKQEFVILSEMGIKTVINLRKPFFFSKGNFSKEKDFVNDLGIKYVNIPMLPYKPPTDQQIKEFFNILSNPDNLPVLVYCRQGKDRTGIMTALYRIKYYEWDYNTAYIEMKKYGYHRLFFPQLKCFLHDYTIDEKLK